MDTEITPGHPSFNDNGIPAPPSRWEGKCEVAGCSNKLIVMRSFVGGESSPVDGMGRGTHTSSTASGNSVDNAEEFGMANGTARGVAPLAHLAMYKIDQIFRNFIVKSLRKIIVGILQESEDISSKKECTFRDCGLLPPGEFCTPEICPTMTASPKYEYRWADGVQIKKPIEVSAPKYVEFLMDWIESQLDDESI
ncbi:hypothetical protein L1987_17325 [Smallanthus sonchifolius]|uniref:Uncharacterized protein n=1 Tax=Smallanthus sonchifolius TaxID=185202 RepID=A0ACB9IXG7_9ASTR|nr:hypothetical protein L1987_17325 [Smallanthus sonchifolius]